MHVISTGGGITEILIATNPTCSNQPYIIFKMPNDNQHYTKLKKTGLTSLGLTKTANEQIIITITSARKVAQAINLFLKMERYNNQSNQGLLFSLKEFVIDCEKIMAEKKPKKLPLTSKSMAFFSKTKGVLNKSNNDTSIIEDKKSSKVGEEKNLYVFKKNKMGRAISEIEVFNAFCFQLLLGDRHPNVESVFNKINTKKTVSDFERVGVISKLLKEYTSVADYVHKKGELAKEKIIQSEMVKVWVAAYCEEERDLHTGNYGFDHTGFCVKIDDDQSTWPLTAKYHGFDPGENNHDLPSPLLSFLITGRDLLSFPKLQDAYPYNWVFKDGNCELKLNYFDELIKDKKFIEDKFYMFLKRILISGEVYGKIGLATISSDKIRNEFVQHKNNKTEKLTDILLTIPEFKDYILDNSTVITNIKNDFMNYNQIYSEQPYLHVDIDKIAEQYKTICEKIRYIGNTYN